MITLKNINKRYKENVISDFSYTFPNTGLIAILGDSGSGKSTLLNRIDKKLDLKTGEVSTALGRGKHTTRLVELIYTNKSLIADTPGFSALDINLTKQEINDGFIEFGYNCQYNTCTHLNDKGCSVIKRVNEGKILLSRYENYKKLIKEAKNESKW